MKLSVSTLPCETWSLEKTLKMCSENGICGIELRLGLNEWSDENMSKQMIDDITTLLKEYSISITNIGSNILVRGYDFEQMECFKNILGLARRLGTRAIRIFLGNFLVHYDDEKLDIHYEGVVKWIKQACDVSLAEGVEVWIETHNEFATGRVLQKLLLDVDRSNCKIIWDIIHPIEQGETVDDTLKTIGQYVAHVHIKDGKKPMDSNQANWEYTKLGEGELPISEIVKKLNAVCYDGFYSLEWESKWREEINKPDCVGELIIPQFAEFMRNIKDVNL